MIIPTHLKQRFEDVRESGDIKDLQKFLKLRSRGTVSNIINGHQETTSKVIERINIFIERKEAKMQLLSNPNTHTDEN